MCAETVQGAGIQVPGNHAAALALIHQQVDGEIFDEELCVLLQRLLVERVQDRVAGPVSRRTGALGGALAELGGHAAECALVDLAFLGPAERHAIVLQLDDRGDGFLTHVLDRVLIAEPVGTLDGVVHMIAPVIIAHIAEGSGNTALCRDGVRARREQLGYAGGLQTGFRHPERCPQTGTTGTDDHNIIFMIDDVVCCTVHRRSG